MHLLYEQLVGNGAPHTSTFFRTHLSYIPKADDSRKESVMIFINVLSVKAHLNSWLVLILESRSRVFLIREESCVMKPSPFIEQ